MGDYTPNKDSPNMTVTHLFANPGFYTCEEVKIEGDGQQTCVNRFECIPTNQCPDQDGQPIPAAHVELYQRIMEEGMRLGNQNHAKSEALNFASLNAENLQKIRSLEQDNQRQQVEAEAKSAIDQMRRDRKEFATQLTELNKQLAAAVEKIAST